MSDRWATFDCYGTLVDWLGGIRATLAKVWPDDDARRAARWPITGSSPPYRPGGGSRTGR